MSDEAQGPVWRPTDHEQARIYRMTREHDQYRNCRHYTKAGDRTFHCNKYQKDRTTCNKCMTCPNCSGLMYTFKIHKHPHRDRIFITHSKCCSLCGVYIEEHWIEQGTKQKEEKRNKCQVEGCKYIAHDQYTTEKHILGPHFMICVTHKDRFKTWKTHTKKGIGCEPLIIVDGKLYDNARYFTKGHK